MADLHLDGVTRRFADVTALEAVDLDVADGEFFTLVGPSGCGKTTTLRTIAGFESPDEGSVRFDDREMTGVPPEDRDVGIVFQNYALFPHMTVAENVAYGLRFRAAPGGKSREERVAELLDLVDLGDFGERDPDALSGGQRQRIALARALAPGPEVLLLDEPMSALDAQLRGELRTQVKQIQSELGITTVYVTHDQEEALAISDRVAVLHDGRVEQVGTPEQVYRNPETRFVAEFLGDNNVFTGEVNDFTGEVNDFTGEVDDGATGTGVEGGASGASAGRAGSASASEPTSASETMRTVLVGDASFRLPVAAPDGAMVTFCVRPADLRLDAGENSFEATVETVEFLGESFRVHLDWAGREVTLRVAERPKGEQVRVGFDPADVHVVEASE